MVQQQPEKQDRRGTLLLCSPCRDGYFRKCWGRYRERQKEKFSTKRVGIGRESGFSLMTCVKWNTINRAPLPNYSGIYRVKAPKFNSQQPLGSAPYFPILFITHHQQLLLTGCLPLFRWWCCDKNIISRRENNNNKVNCGWLFWYAPRILRRGSVESSFRCCYFACGIPLHEVIFCVSMGSFWFLSAPFQRQLIYFGMW